MTSFGLVRRVFVHSQRASLTGVSLFMLPYPPCFVLPRFCFVFRCGTTRRASASEHSRVTPTWCRRWPSVRTDSVSRRAGQIPPLRFVFLFVKKGVPGFDFTRFAGAALFVTCSLHTRGEQGALQPLSARDVDKGSVMLLWRRVSRRRQLIWRIAGARVTMQPTSATQVRYRDGASFAWEGAA